MNITIYLMAINPLNKLLTAVDLIRSGQIAKLFAAISDKYQAHIHIPENNLRYLFLVPVVILEEIHLLLDEHALAFPLRSGSWQVIKLPNFSFGRRIPVITRSVMDTRHGSPRHTELMEDIYSLDGFVTVESDDVVVDVGAYIGTLAFCFADKSSSFISIDPTASVSNVLEYNTAPYPNVIPIPKAAWKKSTELELNRSALPNENSILQPDQHELNSSFTVDANTVPNIVRNFGIEHIDYLKIEAEGVEPEILEAALADGMPIEKIAVDASAERAGDDIIDETVSILESHDYNWQVNEDAPGWGSKIVFGKESN